MNNSTQSSESQYQVTVSIASDQPAPSRVLGGQQGGVSAPCLYSNNCTENSQSTENACDIKSGTVLKSYDKRAAETVFENAQRLIKEVGLNNVAMLTLTFADDVQDWREAQKRFKSFNSHFLAKDPRVKLWMCVKEPTKKGRWHFHMLLGLEEDCRSGFDFNAYSDWLDKRTLKQNRKCPTGSSYLRSLWSELYDVLPKYGFGKIFALEPVKKADNKSISRYVSKYVAKGIQEGSSCNTKGMRRVNYSKNFLRNSPKRSLARTDLGRGKCLGLRWRQQVASFARALGCENLGELTNKLGDKWAYRYEDIITEMGIIDEFPNATPYIDLTVKNMRFIRDYVESLETARKELGVLSQIYMNQKRMGYVPPRLTEDITEKRFQVHSLKNMLKGMKQKAKRALIPSVEGFVTKNKISIDSEMRELQAMRDAVPF